MSQALIHQPSQLTSDKDVKYIHFPGNGSYMINPKWTKLDIRDACTGIMNSKNIREWTNRII